MIAIGYCRVREWDSLALSHFPYARQEMLARITHPGRLSESITATMLLLRMLEGCPPCERPVEYDLTGYVPVASLPDWPLSAHGKPFPEGLLWGGERLYVSLSHGGGYAAVALCSAPVGIDVQSEGDFPEAVAARYGWEPAEAPRLWATGEAVIKLHGGTLADMGAALPPDVAVHAYSVGGCHLAVATRAVAAHI